MFPYINPTFPTHEETIKTVQMACSDEYAATLMKRLVKKYSDYVFTLKNDRSVTFNNYLSVNFKDFVELINKAENE
jgi:hypothetical protein